MKRIKFAMLLSGLLCSTAYAQVEPNRVFIGPDGTDGRYSYVVEQLPSTHQFDDHTGGWFDFEYDSFTGEVTITSQGSLLDEGSDWYFVRSGDVFGRSTIAADNFPHFFEIECDGCIADQTFVTFSPLADYLAGREDGPSDFYLGLATNGPPRTVYGWAKLEIVGGPFLWSLSLVESRVAYNSTGIIVGTSTVIPEPTSAVLLLPGLAIVLGSSRRWSW